MRSQFSADLGEKISVRARAKLLGKHHRPVLLKLLGEAALEFAVATAPQPLRRRSQCQISIVACRHNLQAVIGILHLCGGSKGAGEKGTKGVIGRVLYLVQVPHW